MAQLDKDAVVNVLNRLLEAELAGVVRYTHYSFLVFGFGRIPIVSWLRGQATESLQHAQQIGEWITTLGAYPALAIGPLQDSHKHDIAAMLHESLEIGDRIHTTSGMEATITGVSDDTVDLEIAPGVITTWMKLAVRDKIGPDIEEDEDFEDIDDEESTATEITESPNKKD